MKIKKINLYGFKTFPQPTEITFHDGITTVVGPNGCGKSNIIDALRWVMGEKSAKGLRGDTMSDVIFNGSDSRQALNFAEVTLTLSEVEGKLDEKFGNFHEVAVTRRLHSTGESEYLINKVPCRLRDITDLFLDTGLGKRAYSVVEQGRIDAILSSKPRERRFLIEEAAGLSKYRARRDETLSKMRSTADNLDRINDIIGEVRREMNSLKRQAGRARAFKKLRAEKRELEREAMIANWLIVSEKLQAARAQSDEIHTALLDARTASEKLGADLESKRLGLLVEEKAHEERQRAVYAIKNQVAEHESRRLFLERETEGLAERSARAKQESGELAVRAEASAAEIAQLEDQMDEVAKRLELDQARVEELAEAHSEASERKRDADSALEEGRRVVFTSHAEMSRVANALEHAVSMEKKARFRLESIDRQEGELAEKLQEVAGETAEHQSVLLTAEQARQQALEDRTQLEEDIEDVALDREKLTERVEALRRELHTEQSKLKGLEQLKDNLEWYGTGVKSVLKHAKEENWIGVRGVVAETITVPGEYETALEAALGERLQYVVVADSEQAVDGVAHLKQAKAGRSSFVPVDLKDPAPVKMPSVTEDWARGPLLDLVEVRAGNERLANALLGDIFVVETLEQAIGLHSRNGTTATFVTLEGDTVSPGGVISGGATDKQNAGLLQRNRQIRELKKKVDGLDAELREGGERLEEVKQEHESLKARLEFARDEAHRQELKVAHVSKDMAQFEERSERLNERREALEFERDQLENEAREMAEEAERLEAERAELIRAKEEAEAGQEELANALRKASEAADTLHTELNAVRVQAASDRQRKEGLGHQIRTLTDGRENTLQRSARLAAEADELLTQRRERIEEAADVAQALEEMNAELLTHEGEVSTILSRLDAKRNDLSVGEKDAGQARRQAEETQAKLHAAELTMRELEIETQSLTERYVEKVQGDLPHDAQEGLREDFDAQEVAERVTRLQDKLGRFGELNLLADEEYEDRKARFEFLSTQQQDLEESLASLRNAISKINRISRQRFQETFEQVDAKFREVFPLLFRGGEARLFLTDPEDMLETGIDITARPPGKRPQHISLLSGGEKALTAVALIFALFLVKPSPFCVLDEVDAPLDDANVERFTEILTQMADASQFLVITHNKITMEAADHLYGVTMEDPGISELVSVRLSGLKDVSVAV